METIENAANLGRKLKNEANSAYTQILDSQLPEPWGNKGLLPAAGSVISVR